ncbi:MAG TPA: hypothetical protein VGL63_02880 [Streptosporangiaceae bacterium]
MNTITEQSAAGRGRGGPGGPGNSTTIFGVDLATPDQDALAASQQAFQNLRDAAAQARAAADQAATPAQAEYARQIAAVADAVSNHDVPGLQDSVNGVVSFVAQHPEVVGSQASAFASSANSALSQIQTAIQAIGQVNDAASAANAIDASANAVSATGAWIGVAAGLIGVGGPVVAGILAIGGFLVALAHGIADLIRPSQGDSSTPSTPAETSTPASTNSRSDHDDQPTDTDTNTQTNQPTNTDTNTQTNQQTGPPTTNTGDGNNLEIDTAGRSGSGPFTDSGNPGGGDAGGGGGRLFIDPSSTDPGEAEGDIFHVPPPKKKEAQDPG